MKRKIFLGSLLFANGVFLGYKLNDISKNSLFKANAASIEHRMFPLRVPQLQIPEGIGIKQNSNFIIGYNRRTRTPDWVLEFLTPYLIGEAGEKQDYRKNLDFEFDETEPVLFRSLPRDYIHSGFDRGHMAAAANYKNHELDCRRSFVMSNIAPQVGEGFNRGIWNNLEMLVRAIVRRSDFVYVLTGPLYLPRQVGNKKIVSYEVIGDNDIAVPTHFYKILLIKPNDSPHFRLLSYVLPNQSIPTDPNDKRPDLNKFFVPLETIEKAAGFYLFSPLKQYLTFSQINNNRY